MSGTGGCFVRRRFPTAPPAPRKPRSVGHDTTTSPISTSDARRSREGPAARCSAASRQKHTISKSSACSNFSTPVPPTRVLGVPHVKTWAAGSCRLLEARSASARGRVWSICSFGAIVRHSRDTSSITARGELFINCLGCLSRAFIVMHKKSNAGTSVHTRFPSEF